MSFFSFDTHAVLAGVVFYFDMRRLLASHFPLTAAHMLGPQHPFSPACLCAPLKAFELHARKTRPRLC